MVLIVRNTYPPSLPVRSDPFIKIEVPMMFTATTLLCLATFGSAQDSPELNAKTFDGLLEQILPERADLEWKDIDWRVSLGVGIAEARTADKPILLWAMNGHPLGSV
ncbi:MAG: hypothetical protein ACI8X5_002477 [Planctomycetota bacterium]|jgi:hypothetical protein